MKVTTNRRSEISAIIGKIIDKSSEILMERIKNTPTTLPPKNPTTALITEITKVRPKFLVGTELTTEVVV